MAIDIRVVFDCHVATEKFKRPDHDHLVDPQFFWTDAGGYRRVFHAGRFALSQDLPAMVQGLTNGQTKCYGAQKNNYMIWKPQGAAGLSGPHYQVFFDLYRTNEPQPRLVMYIQSAYLKDIPLGVQRENVKVFASLCSTLMGLIPKKTKGKQKTKRRDRKRED
jgi:hypothetical protein